MHVSFWLTFLVSLDTSHRVDLLDHCCCSVTQTCPTLCNPMDCSQAFVLHSLQEFAQTHVHWVSDAIQPSHPLSSPSPPALNLSQRQGLFQWVSSWLWPTLGGQSIEATSSASVFPMNIQGWSPLGWTGWISLQSKGLSRVFSTPQFESILFGAQPLWSSSHIHTWLLDHMVVLIFLRILYTASHSGCTNLYSHQ